MTRSSILALGLLAAGCAATQREAPPKPFAGTHWQVVLELPTPGEQPSMRFGDGRVEGFGGCNRFHARYVQDAVGARAIAIGRIELDRGVCDRNVMAAQARVLEVLQSVSSYAITADTMTMSGSGGSLKMRARAADGQTTGAPAAASAPVPGLAGTRWMGVVDSSVDPNVRPWLEFVGEGRVSGFTGCNLLNGTWRSEGGEVRIGSVAMTKRGCMGVADELERRVLAALNERSRVTREAEKLVFAAPSGERFEFVPAR